MRRTYDFLPQRDFNILTNASVNDSNNTTTSTSNHARLQPITSVPESRNTRDHNILHHKGFDGQTNATTREVEQERMRAQQAMAAKPRMNPLTGKFLCEEDENRRVQIENAATAYAREFKQDRVPMHERFNHTRAYNILTNEVQDPRLAQLQDMKEHERLNGRRLRHAVDQDRMAVREVRQELEDARSLNKFKSDAKLAGHHNLISNTNGGI